MFSWIYGQILSTFLGILIWCGLTELMFYLNDLAKTPDNDVMMLRNLMMMGLFFVLAYMIKSGVYSGIRNKYYAK